MKRGIPSLFLFLVLILACNAPGLGGNTEEPTTSNPVVIPTIGTEANGVATATLPPPLVATAADSNIESETAQLVALQDMNIRGGPSTGYDVVGFLLEEQTAAITGRAPDTDWWQITCPPNATGGECWISGGAQFTVASNSNEVAIAAVPPTPTPLPTPTPTVVPTEAPVTASTNLYVSYIFAGDIRIIPLQLANNSLVVDGEAYALTGVGNVERVLIAPNGRTVAFTQRLADSSTVSTIEINGSNEQTLLRTSDMPALPESLSDDLIRDIGELEWRTDNSHLMFNTYLYSNSGPGAGSSEDLWQLSLDGRLQEIFPPGRGGGQFATSNNQVVMTTPTEILRANIDGSGREVVANYDSILTYSEYIFYPQIQWATNGSQALLAIPSADPLAPDAYANLWTIPTASTSQNNGRLDNSNFLFAPVLWSPNGRYLATTFATTEGNNRLESLIVADGNGGNQQQIGSSAQIIQALAWSPTESALVYSLQPGVGNNQLFLYTIAGENKQLDLPSNQIPIAAKWVSNDVFLVAASGQNQELVLYSGDSAGNLTSIYSIPAAGFFSFDVWTP